VGFHIKSSREEIHIDHLGTWVREIDKARYHHREKCNGKSVRPQGRSQKLGGMCPGHYTAFGVSYEDWEDPGNTVADNMEHPKWGCIGNCEKSAEYIAPSSHRTTWK
jgi:hypothetical protein